MIEKVEYLKEIIVATVKNQIFRWLVTEKELWFLDYRRWNQAFADAEYGSQTSDAEIAADRFNIIVLDTHTSDEFLKQIKEFEVDISTLNRLLRKELPTSLYIDEIAHLMPSLYVNFDKKHFLSFFYEPASFEDFVPVGWESGYQNFWNLIPIEQRYWIEKDTNLIEKLKEE